MMFIKSIEKPNLAQGLSLTSWYGSTQAELAVKGSKFI